MTVTHCLLSFQGIFLYWYFVLYIAHASSPLDRSKHFTLHPLADLFIHISTTIYSQAGASWRERKCPNFERVAKGIRTWALSIASLAFYMFVIHFHLSPTLYPLSDVTSPLLSPLTVLEFKVHTDTRELVPVVMSNGLRAAVAWSVYITLAAPPTTVRCISSLHAYSYIQQSGRSAKSMNVKNSKKITDS